MCKLFSFWSKGATRETKQTVYKSATSTVTLNGVTRPMTESEMKEFNRVVDETAETIDSFTDSIDKHFDEMNRLFKKL